MVTIWKLTLKTQLAIMQRPTNLRTHTAPPMTLAQVWGDSAIIVWPDFDPRRGEDNWFCYCFPSGDTAGRLSFLKSMRPKIKSSEFLISHNWCLSAVLTWLSVHKATHYQTCLRQRASLDDTLYAEQQIKTTTSVADCPRYDTMIATRYWLALQ